MKAMKFLLPLILFGVLAVFLAAGLGRDPKEVPSPLIDKPAPAFTLARLDQPEVLIQRDQLLGQVWMLNVWASWCVACREEHPLLVEFSRKKSVRLLGLNYKDKRADGARWLAQFGNPYDASIMDTDGKVGIDYGVYGVPETFIVDKQGIVRYKHIGPITEQVLRERIEPLLRKLNA
jgi:cytochrome c biogenesis protein CcmG/thiol:disulfide interchange protein DsbE